MGTEQRSVQDGGFNWKLAGSFGGIASVVLAFGITVAKDAQIALNVSEQHGAELLMIRQAIAELREDVANQTRNHYSVESAAREHDYFRERIDRLERMVHTLRLRQDGIDEDAEHEY